MKYLVNLDLNKNQLLNTAIQNLGTLPNTGLTAGWVVYYTGTGESGAGLYICDGSTWSRVGAPIDSLDQVGDVTITDITSGEVLKWNGSAWVNNTLAEAGIAATSHNHSLDSLSNVTISGNTSGEVLKWNGSAWVNNTLSEAGIQAAGAVTSVTGTSPVVSSGGTTPAISLATAYGDTLNPYASKTANYFLASPNGSAGAPIFRAIVAADIPTLNQNTTGSAGSVANTLTFTGGNTGTFNGSAALSVAVPYTWAQASTKPTYTASEVGLGNVTNDAQMKKIASSTAGYIPTWADTNGNLLATGYSVETTLTGGTSSIPRSDAVKTYVDGLIAASDAMVFKGTVGNGGTYTIAAFNALTVWNAGWTYKVVEAGTIRGQVCQIGDMLVATVDRASAGVDADWTVIQTNIDGAVTGPVSSTSANFATFNGTTGKVIQDSGYNSSSFATTAHQTHYLGKTQVQASSATQAVTGFSTLTFDGGTSGTVQLLPTAVSGTTVLTMPATTGTLALTSQLPTVNNGSLTLGISGTAGGTNTTVTIGTGTGFSANTSSSVTYDIKVGPALTNLAALMTNGSTGVITKTGTDTYALDTTVVKKYSSTLSTSATSYVVTHNLNTQDAVVAVREVAANYAEVFCDVEFTDANTVTLRFASAPAANAYRVTVIG